MRSISLNKSGQGYFYLAALFLGITGLLNFLDSDPILPTALYFIAALLLVLAGYYEPKEKEE